MADSKPNYDFRDFKTCLRLMYHGIRLRILYA
jgi:hypothetical protein